MPRAASSQGVPVAAAAEHGFEFSRVAASTPVLQRAPDAQSGDGAAAKPAPAAPAKKPKCLTGCAQRWGQDTTCSKFGFKVGEHEHAPHFVVDTSGKKPKFSPCCNSWPFALEEFARNRLGLNGAASCPVTHQQEIATVSVGEESIQVLCSDTIPPSMVGEGKPADCSGKIAQEIIELSPQAMQDLSGQLVNPLHATVCFSGTKQDGLCLSDGPSPKKFPEVGNCLTAGCTPEDGTPKLKETGWPRR